MSIFGVGTDRIAIERIESSVDRFGDRFIQRVYTDAEHQQALSKGNTARRLAMLFAAKEAVSKSLGTGFRDGVMLKDIETIHQDSGKPEVVLHGGAARVAKFAGISAVHISLTDDDGVAMAFAIAEL
ncbi:MAG: holo-ACP synthase [Mariprofundaceae bacterium]|nr:holo-ACP synthase [Mariprofundaceae bacterium]